MDTQKIASQFRLASWAEQVKTQISSGQSVRSFCEANKISIGTYYYRQKKVREAACASIATKEKSYAQHPPSIQVVEQKPNAVIPPGWTQLSETLQAKTSISETENHLEIEINGCRIKVTLATDTELLVKTCRALLNACYAAAPCCCPDSLEFKSLC